MSTNRCAGCSAYSTALIAGFCSACAGETLEKIDRHLRRELWLGHGCMPSALYGDDGEMQCAACLLDFERAPIDTLIAHVHARRAELIAVALRAPTRDDLRTALRETASALEKVLASEPGVPSYHGTRADAELRLTAAQNLFGRG